MPPSSRRSHGGLMGSLCSNKIVLSGAVACITAMVWYTGTLSPGGSRAALVLGALAAEVTAAVVGTEGSEPEADGDDAEEVPPPGAGEGDDAAISAMLQDLFGSHENLRQAALQWQRNKMSQYAKEVEATAPDDFLDRSVWVRYARILHRAGRLRGKYPQLKVHDRNTKKVLSKKVSTLRSALNTWNAELAQDFQSKGHKFSMCGENGDGHFLKDFHGICDHLYSMDAYDPRANLKLDLDKHPKSADDAVRDKQGSFEVILCHQVFEHLTHPSMGIAVLNSMLKTNGILVFSVPFLKEDHNAPKDYFRYSVRNVQRLLECGGFAVKTLQGRGSLLTTIGNLAKVADEHFSSKELGEFCNGISKCQSYPYTMVGAVAIKTSSRQPKEVSACWG